MQIVNSCNFSKDNLTTRRYGNWVWVISLVPQNIYLCMYISWFRIFFRLLVSRWREIYSFWGYLRTFQKATSKIDVFLFLPSETAKPAENGKTWILVLAFWNFKLKVLKYQWNFRPHATLIQNLVKPLM